MTKLLNKPLKVFTVFAVIIFVFSIPAYFYLVESIWIDELDDHNQEIKKQINKGFSGLNPEQLESSIDLWNRVHPESRIKAIDQLSNDSIYTTERAIPDQGVMELERFRGLLSTIELNKRPYRIRIETNVEEVHETILAISKITSVFILVLIAGFVLLSRQLSKKIWKPFTITLEKLRQFDLNSSTRLDLAQTDISEFAELNETLEKLIENNIKVFKQQQEFTQNASHELQTPLALLKSKLDLLIQDSKLTDEQRSIIDSLHHSIARITRINKNLLLLARIENRDFETSKINMNAMVGAITGVFKEYSQIENREITVQSIDSFNVVANEGLVEVLINNLLSNAIRHGKASTPITLSIANNAITIINFGPSELNPGALFKRFISADSQTQGTGLGLAIVKEICDKYDWKVSYSFQDEQHIFVVNF